LEIKERKPTTMVSTESIGKKLVLCGFIQNVRNVGKNLKFVILQDWDGDAQIVFSNKSLNENKLDQISRLTLQSVIIVTGTVQKSTSTKYAAELLVSDFEIISESEAELPIDVAGKTETALNKRLDWRPLDLRVPENQAIFKIQSKLVEGTYEYLTKSGFTNIFTPCLMGVPSESGAETFTVSYFEKNAFLRQDPQLHRQLTIAGGFEKIFEIGPSWRAELSHTTRHLCEHRGIAVEIAYLTSEEDTMRLEEQVIVAALKKVKSDCKEELKLLGKEVEIPKTPFPELRYPEIYKILEGLGSKIKFGEDNSWEDEQLLAKYVKEKYNSDFFFINRFPFAVKPFYVMRLDEDKAWARSVDLVYNGIEISSGGQREHRYKDLMQNVKEKNMKNVEWFTNNFKYGVPPHGGFCIGVERLTKQLLGIENVRETTLYPRDPERLVP
jgi:nondiscriminating aspartyl-tRNA synthetase